MIDPFYEPAASGYEAGQVWCDQPLYMPARHGIKIARVDPQDDRKLDLEVVGRTADTFNHPPIKSLGLESSEALVAARAKKNRPVILLGGDAATELFPKRATHADTVMVVPVYGADQFDEHTRQRMAYYEWANVFYLPACNSPAFEEGFARLDHVQPVKRDLLANHRGFRLAADALDALIEWLLQCLTGRIDEGSLILDFRRQMLTELQ